MGRVNSIVFREYDYKRPGYLDSSKEETDYDEMYEDIMKLIRILIKTGYQMKIWNDCMTTVIEYDYQDESISGRSLEWLGEDEYIGKYRDEDEEEDKQ